jgi:bifunctional DNA-binding transcriptional regulator/antitoxin component of YhaV-PrlF toxin-antitoxin module
MEYMTQIQNNGRILVPVRLRKALQISDGDPVIMQLENDSIRIIPLRNAIKLAQETVSKYVPKGVSMVDALIEQRRDEARNE